MYRCFHCARDGTKFSDIINHITEDHSNEELKLQKLDGNKVRTVNFKIIPDLAREQGRVITINAESETIHLSRANTIPKDSPFKKVCRYTSTPIETSLGDTECDGESEISETETDKDDSTFKELVELLPGVINTLKDGGRLSEYVAFNRLLHEGDFPLDNIAFILFLDVVRWFTLDESTQMRYSDPVKLFWLTGLRLFHGRFLRFMGGPKHTGQIILSETSPGRFSPQSSKVNFVVPSRTLLQNEEIFVQGNEPGIFPKMIEKLAQSDPDQHQTYKMCVDGKKVNPCSGGEVNLWNYEDTPTFKDKQIRLAEEKVFFEESHFHLERHLSAERTSTDDLPESEVVKLAEKCRESVSVLSNRIKDLRQRKVKKSLVLQKLLDKCQSDWRSSQYSMVISSIRTSVYQVDNCIEDLLSANDNFCKYARDMTTQCPPDSDSSTITMQTQENYVCLGNSNESPPLTRQRTDAWFRLRETALVTGSSINKAIGLEGLKKQKEYLQEKVGLKAPAPVSEDLQRRFDYGTENEVNAVATFITTFLPAFCPELSFYEEGCYIVEGHDGNPHLIVSPDGSVRNQEKESDVIAGIEIKCPYPGKNFTTPVHYEIPRYYIPQILSEMHCLGVNNLYYMSYSAESMAIHNAEFQLSLWNRISEEITNVNANKSPKKLSDGLPKLKAEIDEYRKTKVSLIAEVKSRKAILCDHPDADVSRIYHTTSAASTMVSKKPVDLSEVYRTYMRCEGLITECHRLCAIKASEVLVFLVADLDRVYKQELPHAFPVAYGLKGYSMKTEAMRKMIQDVLLCLFMKGLYTPVISYDGQWAKLALQTQHGAPLTLLQLQRNVYNDVKSRSVSVLTRQIFEAGIVKAKDRENFLSQVDCSVNHYTGSITLGLKDSSNIIRPSLSIISLMKTKNKTVNDMKDTNENPQEDLSACDIVVSSVSPEMLPTLDDKTLSEIQTVNMSTKGMSLNQGLCDIGDAIALFTDEAENTSLGLETEEVSGTEDMEINGEFGIGTQLSTDLSSERSTPHDMNTPAVDGNNQVILAALQVSPATSSKWSNVTLQEFSTLTEDSARISQRMTKAEIILSLDKLNEDKPEGLKLKWFKSWNKQKLVDLFHAVLTSAESMIT